MRVADCKPFVGKTRRVFPTVSTLLHGCAGAFFRGRRMRMSLLRCPKFLRCLTADAGNFDRGHSLTSLPLPLAALGSLPTGALRPRNDRGLYLGCGARPGGSSGRPAPTHRLPIKLRRGRRPRRPVTSQVARSRKGLPYRFNFPCGGPGRQRRFGPAYIRFPRGIALLQRRKAPDPAHRPDRGWERR